MGAQTGGTHTKVTIDTQTRETKGTKTGAIQYFKNKILGPTKLHY